MLHEAFRNARIAAGMSQSELARRSGVLRKQVRAVEEGENVTLATLRKIIEVLPSLERVTLGGTEIRPADANLEEARRAALDLFDVARRLMGALGVAPNATTRPAVSQPERDGTRYDGVEDDRRRAAELEPLAQKIRRAKRRGDA